MTDRRRRTVPCNDWHMLPKLLRCPGDNNFVNLRIICGVVASQLPVEKTLSCHFDFNHWSYITFQTIKNSLLRVSIVTFAPQVITISMRKAEAYFACTRPVLACTCFYCSWSTQEALVRNSEWCFPVILLYFNNRSFRWLCWKRTSAGSQYHWNMRYSSCCPILLERGLQYSEYNCNG